MSLMKSAIPIIIDAVIPLVWGMVGATLIVAAYHIYLRPAQPNIATVDIVDIMQDQRSDALKAAAKPGASDADIRRASEQIQTYGVTIDQAVTQFAHEHNIILIQKQAVVAGQAPDMTDDIQRTIKNMLVNK